MPGRYIVVMNDAGAGKNALATERLIDEADASDVLRYDGAALLGFAGTLSDDAVARLRSDPAVKYVEPDRIVSLGRPGSGGGAPPAQATPWGITRVGGARDGTGKTAWVIDTGIDLDHPDLNVDAARSQNFVSRETSADDLNGHGTHVAGTIAALNNAEGVVGVAYGASVVAVRVLNRRGSGSYSDIIAGVNYVAGTGRSGDAANMSLGGGASQALDDAIKAAAAKGIRFALAAGNESQDASNTSPARLNATNVFTISAIGQDDCLASFSNFGEPVDFAAPGVGVLSSYKDGGYATLSGTSMAAPHVAGLLLFSTPRGDGFACKDLDGKADPIAHS